MEIEWSPLDRVKPYENNPRKIGDAAIGKVSMSLREYGWKQPLVVEEDGTLIVGHTRSLAAHALVPDGTLARICPMGLPHVPVLVATGLTEDQIKAYRIADNRTGEESEWDRTKLTEELADLGGDFDMSLLGFDDKEITALLDVGPLGLDELGNEHGEHKPSNFWPKVSVSVPPELQTRFNEIMARFDGEPNEQLSQVLDFCEAGIYQATA